MDRVLYDYRLQCKKMMKKHNTCLEPFSFQASITDKVTFSQGAAIIKVSYMNVIDSNKDGDTR